MIFIRPQAGPNAVLMAGVSETHQLHGLGL